MTKTATTYIPQAFDPMAIRVGMNASELTEQARQVAVQQGYNAGLDQARADIEAATNEANTKVRRAMASLREATDNFDNREATALLDVEDEIIRAAFEIARAVVGRELQLTTDPGAEAIARAMQLAPSRADVVAHINPEDAATLNVDTIPTNGRNLVIFPDPTVELGGCVLDAGKTSIDAQFSSIFTNVLSALGLTTSDVADGIATPDSRTTASEAPLS